NGLGALGWTHPHNFFVELLCDGGLIGFFIGTTVVAIPALLILRSLLGGAGAYFMILSTFWLNHFAFSMVSGDVGQNRIVYTLSALIVSYCTDGMRRRNVSSPLNLNVARPVDPPRKQKFVQAGKLPSSRENRLENANLSIRIETDKIR
ncbi:MAG: hypothetical protein KDA68_09160, partial [Planctomycetaceae bacterium]|nr:hypothetical protein [Planctomycetaceae bacterium]